MQSDHPIDPVHLTADEYKRLRLQARRSVGRISERIHYVLLFSRGRSLREIAAVFDTDERTVAAWLDRFREQGLEGLSDLPRSGRPRLASAAAHTEARRCLDASPQDVGLERTSWTRRLLGRHL